jgi:Arc/MetJ-type ribon-helix-helix transcriptional regulator
MPIVNFAVPEQLEKQINATIKKKGFASKAEFFRFATMYYLDNEKKTPTMTEDERLDYLTDSIRKAVVKKYKGVKLPSAAEQLADF